MPSLTRSAVFVASVLSAGTLLMTGCSAGRPAAAPTVTVTATATAAASAATTPSSAAAPAGPGPCRSSALKVTLGPGNSAAGTSQYPIRFTNISGSACTLYGFPGVSFTGETYAVQVGPAAQRNHASPEALVTLAPGAVASALITVKDANAFPAACGQTTASGVLVYPPNMTTSVGLPFNGMTCASGKFRVLTVAAVVAGPGT
jgi:hypothetical protein